ncbi:DUF190 domain-containing protein [Candidatus Latescibacterota bacterium]
MREEATAILLRIFIGENDKFHGKPLYQYLSEYLRKHHYSGVTVLRGLLGFGHASKLHTANLLSLSSDLPIILEIVDSEKKIEDFKNFLDEQNIIESGLITEEKVHIIRYGNNETKK